MLANFIFKLQFFLIYHRDAKVADLVQSSEISCGTSEQAAIVQRAPSSQRWVPPTVRENTGPTEIVFRKIRGYV